MVRKAKDEVQAEEVVEQSEVQAEEVKETVAMVRDESYPEPRTADVHPDAVEEWKTFGWTEK